jgi:solute carrier family 25 (mitochondrial folate transporter), member 32
VEGSLTAVATAPLWTLKSRLQTDMLTGAKRRYTSVWSGLRKIAADEGFPALYKGLSPTLLGLGHVMLQFPIYEGIKGRLSNNCEDEVRPVHVLVASSISKIVASAAFYHHEVVRTGMQIDVRVHGRSEPARMAYLYRDIMRREGLRGLYRGFGVNLLRTVPNCVIAFSAYEYAKRLVLRSAGDVLEAKGEVKVR